MMESDQDENDDLDPRIQIELEKLNNATDEINRLETELDEANTNFRLLLNNSTHRLKLSAKKLGSCIEKARPYYEALEVAKQAQLECQKAAVQFQRANEVHQAAKETVALAEQRFLSKQHEWQFDNAWQEVLNHATLKVMEAEAQKAESGREHQQRATLFHSAERKVQQLEQRYRRSIIKSRPYFEEKEACQQMLMEQKARVESLQSAVSSAKRAYALSLHSLECISEEIHHRRQCSPSGKREPGVGAELEVGSCEKEGGGLSAESMKAMAMKGGGLGEGSSNMDSVMDFDLEQCELRSVGGLSATPSSSAMSDADEVDDDGEEEQDFETLKQQVRDLRPIDGEDRSSQWEEISAAVMKLGEMMKEESDEKEDIKTREGVEGEAREVPLQGEGDDKRNGEGGDPLPCQHQESSLGDKSEPSGECAISAKS
ncbi:SH3 domain-binding protein 5 homolog [Ischnura elegans]|uniref:SH3 domain-binding protein 5 homolog n=1 Tax=Ischnura elegans TaxID=197161 RepID=UPI001ED86A92|nr:SH3 domain-binding protein 5 homolog [Ischnura elegans]